MTKVTPFSTPAQRRFWCFRGDYRKRSGYLKFSDEEVEVLSRHLIQGAMAHGYPNELWTLRRVSRLIPETFGKSTSPSEVWRLLKRMNWSPQKPERKARERDEEKIQRWKEETWPELCEKARKEDRTIVFVDECGFSQKSTAKKTWAPVGQAPVIEMNFHWEKLSVIGGISLKSIYFQMHEESIKSEQVIGFLDHLQRYVKGNNLANVSPKATEPAQRGCGKGSNFGQVSREHRNPRCAGVENGVTWRHVSRENFGNFPNRRGTLCSRSVKGRSYSKHSGRKPSSIWGIFCNMNPFWKAQ